MCLLTRLEFYIPLWKPLALNYISFLQLSLSNQIPNGLRCCQSYEHLSVNCQSSVHILWQLNDLINVSLKVLILLNTGSNTSIKALCRVKNLIKSSIIYLIISHMTKDTYQSIRRLGFLFSWLSKEVSFLTREKKNLLRFKEFQTKTKENNIKSNYN